MGFQAIRKLFLCVSEPSETLKEFPIVTNTEFFLECIAIIIYRNHLDFVYNQVGLVLFPFEYLIIAGIGGSGGFERSDDEISTSDDSLIILRS